MPIKTFDQIKAAVEAVALKKQAAESSTPKDPNEVSTPSVKEEGTIKETCLNVPEGKANDKAVEKQTSSIEVKDSTEESAIKPKEEESCKVTEQTVTKRGSDLLAKIKEGIAAKTASVEQKQVKKVEEQKKEAASDNIASGITLSVDALAKIASEILNTEEGAKFTTNLFRKKAGEEYAAAIIEEAAEQAKLYKIQEEEMKNNPLAKIASEIEKLPEEEQKIFAHRLEVHSNNLNAYDHEILKRAYAAGAEDAEALINNPDLLAAAEAPTEEQAGEADITPEEVMEAVSEMVEAGELDEATANQVIEEIINGAETEAAGASEEEAGADAVAKGEAEQAAAADAIQDKANTAKLASEIVQGTILLKKASAEEGLIEDKSDASLEDVISVIEALKEEGSLSDEDAANVIAEIAEAIDEGDEDSVEISKEDVKPEDEKDGDDDEEEIDTEVEKVASELGVK